MQTNLLKEAIECLDEGRRLVHYYDDCYAIYLLEYLIENNEQIKIGEIRQSPFSKLLERPRVKTLIAKSGNGCLSRQQISEFIADEFHSYVITLSTWGENEDYSWSQTSRPGSNLVMQLNLTNEHDEFLRQLKIESDTFKCYSHPVNEHKNSVAWVRVDFDWNSGEALIEEVQNDWIRLASWHRSKALKARACSQASYKVGYQFHDVDGMLRYTGQLISRYKKRWQETSLFYAIDLVVRELGLKRIFYHTEKSGAVMKNIQGRLPPKSLYKDLPEKFCFRKTQQGPNFILRDRRCKKRLKQLKGTAWYSLLLD